MQEGLKWFGWTVGRGWAVCEVLGASVSVCGDFVLNLGAAENFRNGDKGSLCGGREVFGDGASGGVASPCAAHAAKCKIL